MLVLETEHGSFAGSEYSQLVCHLSICLLNKTYFLRQNLTIVVLVVGYNPH